MDCSTLFHSTASGDVVLRAGLERAGLQTLTREKRGRASRALENQLSTRAIRQELQTYMLRGPESQRRVAGTVANCRVLTCAKAWLPLLQLTAATQGGMQASTA